MAAAFAEARTNDVATVHHRQGVLGDRLANRGTVRQLYAIAVEPFSRERSWNFGLYGRDPASMVGSAVRTLQNCFEVLHRLRDMCLARAGGFASRGFQHLVATLESDLDDAFLAAVRADLDNLTFRKGLLLGAQVGDGG
jgi:hypothetical protein